MQEFSGILAEKYVDYAENMLDYAEIKTI